MRFLEADGASSVALTIPCWPGAWLIAAVYIGRKIPGWKYPDNSTRRVAENTQGFLFVGQVFGGPAASVSD